MQMAKFGYAEFGYDESAVLTSSLPFYFNQPLFGLQQSTARGPQNHMEWYQSAKSVFDDNPHDGEALYLPRALAQREIDRIRSLPHDAQVAQTIGIAASTPFRGRLTGPIQFFGNLLETWKLNREDAVPLLGFEKTDQPYVEHLLNGHAALLGRDVKDRIAYLFEIRRTLAALFLDEDVENAWLREAHAMLNDQVPMELLLGGTMENILLVRDFVDVAAGR